MRDWIANARAPRASGRFVWVAAALLLGAGCTLVRPIPASLSPPSDGGGARLSDPVVAPGRISARREAEAARLFAQAREAMETGRPAEAYGIAERIVEEFPSAPVSGRALYMSALAAAAAGDPLAADVAAERYIALLEPGDPREGSLRILQAEAVPDPAARVDRLMRIPPGADGADFRRGVQLARAAADSLEAGELTTALARSPADSPLRWVLEVRAGVAALEEGDDEAASRYAERALALGASGPDSVTAEGLLRRELPGGRPAVSAFAIATVLPTGGPPALANFAARIAEGVEVAAATVLGDRARVSVDSRDDQADPALAASLVAELERGSALGAVGFLEDAALEAAGQARSRGLPIVSPTARTSRLAGDGAYSLEGPDPLAATSIARYAAGQGFRRVAIVHSQTPESSEEADAFQSTIEGLGVPVVGRFAYPAGATFFENQIKGAEAALRRAEIAALGLGEDDTLFVEMLEPVALFLPIPSEDVEFVAPQVTHFGLDTLAINILGTSGWTDPRVLETVDMRHTTGVVATSAVGREPGSPGRQRFRQAYEQHFQRSLVSPVPALGYDAALLLLEALRDGPTSPRQIRASFERLRDVEGATGIYSVIDGRIVRRTQVVHIDNRALVPIL